MLNAILERIECIDSLIRMRETGTPSQLAKKLRVSDRSVYDYLRLMKSLNAPIKFCPISKTYYYELDGRFVMSFEENNNKQKRVNASGETMVARLSRS